MKTYKLFKLVNLSKVRKVRNCNKEQAGAELGQAQIKIG